MFPLHYQQIKLNINNVNITHLCINDSSRVTRTAADGQDLPPPRPLLPSAAAAAHFPVTRLVAEIPAALARHANTGHLQPRPSHSRHRRHPIVPCFLLTFIPGRRARCLLSGAVLDSQMITVFHPHLCPTTPRRPPPFTIVIAIATARMLFPPCPPLVSCSHMLLHSLPKINITPRAQTRRPKIMTLHPAIESLRLLLPAITHRCATSSRPANTGCRRANTADPPRSPGNRPTAAACAGPGRHSSCCCLPCLLSTPPLPASAAVYTPSKSRVTIFSNGNETILTLSTVFVP